MKVIPIYYKLQGGMRKGTSGIASKQLGSHRITKFFYLALYLFYYTIIPTYTTYEKLHPKAYLPKTHLHHGWPKKCSRHAEVCQISSQTVCSKWVKFNLRDLITDKQTNNRDR